MRIKSFLARIFHRQIAVELTPVPAKSRDRAARAVLALPLGLALLWLAPATAIAAEDGSVLQQDILRALARGEDASEKLALFQASGASAGTVTLTGRNTRAAEFAQQSGALNRLLQRLAAQASLGYGDLRDLDNAVTILKAEHLLFKNRFERLGRQLGPLGAGGFEERHNAVYARYLETVKRLFAALDGFAPPDDAAQGPADEALQERLRAAISSAAPLLRELTARPPRKILRNSLLPYRPSDYSARLPQLEPAILPSYAMTTAPATASDDLASTLDAPLSQEILAQAKALDYDFIRIFDFVRGQVQTEWYAGAMKGATGTLRQMRGNDIDQASLLLALLRASGLPSRYVHGVIELPIESIQASLALDSAAQALKLLSKAGIAYSPEVRGGRIAAVHIEHTWLSVYMPYTNYRGAVIDSAGKSWLPLFPALKQNSHQPSTRVLDAMDYDVDAAIDEYLYTSASGDLLASIRGDVEDHLAQTDAAADYADQLGASALAVEALGLIPHSLPVRVIAVTAEAAQLDERYRQSIQFILRAGTRDNAPVLLDYQLPVSELASERVTLSYLPATAADQAVVNQFGGLDNVPAYLVQLRPQIKINGRLKKVASAGLEMASQHRFEILLHGPGGTERIEQTVIAGGYHAIAVQAGAYAPSEQEGNPADTEYQAARLLNQLAQSYSSAWRDAEAELAGLLDVAVLRPAPSIAIASNLYRVDALLGQPMQLEFSGVSLDAAYRVAEPIARDASDATARDWMRLAALQGSTLEAKIFRDLFLLDALSADLGLRQALAQSIPLVTIDAANVDTVLPGLLHPAEVIEDVHNWVRLGLSVTIPQTEIVYNEWQGSVWRVEDSASGAGGYFIAGGLAGGTTTQQPSGWLLIWLAQALTSSNGIAPSNDTLSVASLTRVSSTDGQEGKVGETLPAQLSVIARDDDGVPVAGARVTFSASAGGGKFDGEDGVVVVTNSAGIASAAFTLGERTDANPRYRRLADSDKYYSRVGLNLVEASTTSRTGLVIIDVPFSAIGYPGEVTQLVRTNGHNPVGFPNLGVDRIGLQPRDEFDNPVANVDTSFQITSGGNSCNPAPSSVLPGAVYDTSLNADGELANGCRSNPVLGDCGSQSKTLTSTVFGVSAGVILGNTTQTDFTVTATAAGISKNYAYRTSGSCSSLPSFLVSASSIVNEADEAINAVRAGETFKPPVQARVMAIEPAFDLQSGWPKIFLSNSSAYPVNADVVFRVSNGGSAGTVRHPETGVYETNVATGSEPGINGVRVEVRNIVATGFLQRLQDTFDSKQADEYRESIEKTLKDGIDADILDIYGLEPSIVGVISPVPPGMDPDAIFVNDNQQAEFGAEIRYQVLPGSYPLRLVDIELYENGTLRGSLPATAGSGFGSAAVIRSTVFDPDNLHQAEVVLNRGSSVEVRSDRFEIKVGQRLFSNYPNFFKSTIDIDTLNQRVCTQGSVFSFTTTQDARISLEFTSRDDEDDVTTIVDDRFFAAGEHELQITPLDLLPGSYSFELKGVVVETALTEIKQGGAFSHYSTRDQLPVGHTLVKGVDLFNGGLAVSSTDMAVSGRGLPLEFTRTYSSLGSDAPGPLGYGWSHNYDSRIIITPCGEVIVIGAQGGGMRFVEDGNGGLRPLKGYHGTLVPDFTDNTFDFYSKDGTRYHYRNMGLSEDKEWNLEYAEDTNGNLLKFGYDESSRRRARLIVVDDTDATKPGDPGRLLTFTWESRFFTNFENEPTDVIVAVEGPDGMMVSFDYDEYGNLISADRDNGSRVEAYSYSVDQDDFDLRHKLVLHTDANGKERQFDYSEGKLSVSDNSIQYLLPLSFTTQVIDPEGGITSFDFSKLNGTDTTTVTNGRGFDTRYTMNNYGSVLRIDDPVGSTSMTWASDDVLMTSRTDANGARTAYDHDEHGNVIEETVSGVGGSYSIVRSYRKFAGKPWIKNRVGSETDRNEHQTLYDYDGNGNLTGIVDAEGNSTVYGYDERGDRIYMRDPNGNETTFRYDVEDYGNLSATIGELGYRTETDWDIRSRAKKRTDANGNSTRFAYDNLDRLIVQTDAYGNTREFSYDPVGNKLSETDAEGRFTSWTYDGENRVETHTDALDNTMSYSYDKVGNRIGQTDWRGNPTVFAYDAADRMITQTEPLGKVTRYGYDPVGNLKTQTDAEGRVTAYAYDLLNRQISITDAQDGVTRSDYDGVNRIAVTDPLGRKTDFAYDRINRLLTQTEPLGRITQFSYDRNGNRLSETDANGNIQRTEYDALNRAVRALDALNNETRYEYDKVGNRIRVIDARLHESRVEYDKLNRPVLQKDAGGFVTRFEYDRVGNKSRETWPNGNVIDTLYDGLNRPLSQSDSLGPISAAAYDENGNRVRETDANGNVSIHSYDALNRLTQSDLPEARTLKFSYDFVGNRKTATDARDNTTRFDYDDLNRVVTVTDPLGKTVVSSYDPVGNRLSETDKRGHSTRFDYDELNRLTQVTDALDQIVSNRYDPVGNKIGDTDRRGTVTDYTYDALNRLVRTTRDNIVINSREYDEVGNVKFDTDANGNITAFIYDKRNLMITESRPLAAISHFTYDAMGDRLTARDPEGRTSTTTYDLRRRAIAESNALGETTTYAYDGNGNRTRSTRPLGNAWNFIYDGADRLTEITDAASGSTRYAYDGNGNRLSQADANDYITAYSYDVLNRQTATIYTDGASESYVYDENGNRTQLTDAKNQVFIYSYDQLNRETERRYPPPAASSGDDILSIATDWDANNNPVTITEQYGGATGTRVTTKAYDNFDRLQRVTDAFGKTLVYSYDANGNRTRLKDPDGKLTHYRYDELNRLVDVTTAAGVSEYAYDRSSLQTRVTYPNGTSAENRFDNARRIEQIQNRQGTAIISQYDYSYDTNGNRTSQVEINGGAAETTTYAYDGNDRLTRVDYPDSVVAYTFDANYNRLTEQSTDKASGSLTVDKTFGYDNRNQLEAVTDNLDASQNVVYQFDANGNQTIKSKNGVTTTFIYDVRDKLLGVREDATTLGQYFYDYQGMRVAKTGDKGLLRYTYDDDSVLLQSDAAGNTIAKYEYGPDRLLSLNHATEGRQFYHFDALGSTVNLSKPDASIQARYQYDAWGNFRSESGSSFNAFTFTGHEKDSETDLYYFKARYYDPDTGRFLSQDSSLGETQTPPSLHRYLYAYGNPTIYWDPDGNVTWLKNVAEGLDNFSSTSFAAAGDIDNLKTGNIGGDSFRRLQAIGLGVNGTLAAAGSALTRGVNFFANAGIATVSDDRDIQAELDESFAFAETTGRSLKDASIVAGKDIAENPSNLIGFGGYVGESTLEGLNNTFIQGKGSSLANFGGTLTALLPAPKLLPRLKGKPRVITESPNRPGVGAGSDNLTPYGTTLDSEIKALRNFGARTNSAQIRNERINLGLYKDVLSRDIDSIISKLDVSAAPDTSVFWSGNKAAAIEYANRHGKVTLETTAGGRLVDDWKLLNKSLPWSRGGEEFWGGISTKYARGTSGDISIIQTPDRALSAKGFEWKGGYNWQNYEKPVIDAYRDTGRVGKIDYLLAPSEKYPLDIMLGNEF